MREEKVMAMSTSRVFLAGAITAAVFGTFLACSAAHANGNNETTSRTVRFGDLDLDSSRGADHLFLRLKLAAEAVCGDANDAVSLDERAEILRCQQKAVEGAVERVDRPLLTRIYDLDFPHEPALASASLPSAPRG
jgi:UrcA family protein